VKPRAPGSRTRTVPDVGAATIRRAAGAGAGGSGGGSSGAIASSSRGGAGDGGTGTSGRRGVVNAWAAVAAPFALRAATVSS
jgi:hypothetical protein